jgi:hypothetical protein
MRPVLSKKPLALRAHAISRQAAAMVPDREYGFPRTHGATGPTIGSAHSQENRRMKRTLYLIASALIGLLAANVRAAELDPTPGCDGWSCGDPCGKLRLGPVFGPEHTQRLIDQANSKSEKARITAVRKLGCQLHADFCKNPEVLNALTHALSCDPRWEVRWEAVWSIAGQGACVPEAVFALYLASRLEKHYMVRADAERALQTLTAHCKSGCQDLYHAADALLPHLGCDYDPAKGKCVDLIAAFHNCHWAGAELLPANPAIETRSSKPEPIPAPKEPGKDLKEGKEVAGPQARPKLTTLSGAPASQ